ncbi:MAG TPA: DinB family protein [Gemmatimonadaceae bacterium]|nr:DinB family protein [Gemmatimonadaceae bacterium]
MTDLLRRMFDHVAWADRDVLANLRAARGVDAKALELLSHVLAAEHVWLSRIAGRTASVSVWPALSFDVCERLADENALEFTALLSRMGADMLERPVTYRNSAGDQFTSTVRDILTHVALHGSYHRGQIAALVRAAGTKPALTDFIAFARGAPAATRQP